MKNYYRTTSLELAALAFYFHENQFIEILDTDDFKKEFIFEGVEVEETVKNITSENFGKNINYNKLLNSKYYLKNLLYKSKPNKE